MIVQITERIFIGSSQVPATVGVSAGLNVALDLDRAGFYDGEYAKIGLVDGPGNLPGTLMAAVLMLAQLLERHKRVVVFCHMGISRSPIVVALYLAYRSEKMTIDQAIGLVKTRRPEADPAPALIDLAKIVLQNLRR